MSLQNINFRTSKRIVLQLTFASVTVLVLYYLCTTILLSGQQTIFHQFLFGQNKLVLDEKLIKSPLSTESQDDPRLIQLIKKDYLTPPSRLSYKLTGKDNPSLWQAETVHTLLKNKKNGFFIECGAHDGEFLSNTLMIEKIFGWEGLLIEADPSRYEQLISKHRKAWTVPACLSINNYPSEAMMRKVWNMEGNKATYSFWKITNDPIQQNIKDFMYKVQCFPLYSVLLALNKTKIDYLSLDVEGNELNIFKTIPWDKINITVITAEFNHVDQGKNALREYMESKGYKVHIDGSTLKVKQNIDFVFYHPDLI